MISVRLVRMNGRQVALRSRWWQRLVGRLRGRRDMQAVARAALARSQRAHHMRLGIPIGRYELHVYW